MRWAYQIGYVTHPGKVRTDNQDSLLIRRGKTGEQELVLLAVADGVGGLAHGGAASARAIACLDAWWKESLPTLLRDDINWKKLEDSLSVAIEGSNTMLLEQNAQMGTRSGTTLTVAFVAGNVFRLFQVGDSRCYHLGSHGVPTQLTRDQTWCQQEIERGSLTPGEALTHPKRHLLTSALGVTDQYMLACSAGTLEHRDGLLLCSDGFYQEAPLERLQECRMRIAPQKALDHAVHIILNGTAEDNLTAILLRVKKRWR